MDYTIYLGKNDTDRTLHEFEGLVKGILLDNDLNKAELFVLKEWINENLRFISNKYKNKSIVKEVYITLHNFFKGIDKDKADEVFECLRNISFKSIYFDENTNNIHILIGILRGIIADKVINQKEVSNLIKWLKNHSELKSNYPYNTLIKLLKIGTSDEGNVEDVMHKLTTLCDNLSTDDVNKSVINYDIVVTFKEKHFCFSGYSNNYSRKEVQNIIENNGGIFHKSISKRVNYLILADNKSEGWAYGSYGRKIEDALKEGISIVPESVLAL